MPISWVRRNVLWNTVLQKVNESLQKFQMLMLMLKFVSFTLYKIILKKGIF